MSQWAYGGNTVMDITQDKSPYTWYRESTVGNPNVHWEKVTKYNFGVDFGFLGGLITGSTDVFHDHRTDILVKGSDRSVPSYFGQTAPTANLGVVNTSGYEVQVKLNKVFANTLRLWADMNFTHAVNTTPRCCLLTARKPDMPSDRRRLTSTADVCRTMTTSMAHPVLTPTTASVCPATTISWTSTATVSSTMSMMWCLMAIPDLRRTPTMPPSVPSTRDLVSWHSSMV